VPAALYPQEYLLVLVVRLKGTDQLLSGVRLTWLEFLFYERAVKRELIRYRLVTQNEDGNGLHSREMFRCRGNLIPNMMGKLALNICLSDIRNVSFIFLAIPSHGCLPFVAGRRVERDSN
jgi:hypothetical protein